MRTHLTVSEFPEGMLEAASELFDAKPWTLDPAARNDAYRKFVRATEDAHGLAMFHLVVNGARTVNALFKTVASQLRERGLLADATPKEWAYSLFYSARPEMFRARVREGRIPGMYARDTYTQESWQRLVDADFTDGDNLAVTRQIATAFLKGEVQADEVTSETSEETVPFGGMDGCRVSDAVLDAAEAADVTMARREELMGMGIVKLRQLSRGHVSGGYNMDKPSLVNALIEAGV